MGKVVSICLLNWNGKEFIEACIDSVLKQSYPDIQLMVIDNGSTDGSVDLIETRYPNIQLMKNQTNEGYSRAHNYGIRLAGGDYVMPLNFDIVMDKDFVAELVKAAESDPRIGAVSGKLLRLSGEGKTNILDSTGHLIYANRYVVNRGEDTEDRGQYDQPDFVFGVCGGASLYRRAMLEDVKVDGEYFDESFFLMLEDVDLDWRSNLRGWKAAYTPKAVAYHHRGGSGAQKSRLVQRHYYKNRYLTFIKNDRLGSVMKHYPGIWLMDVYLHLDLLFTAPVALLQGWWDLARLLPQTLKKRRLIQARRRVGAADIEKWFRRYNYVNDIKRKLHLQNRSS